MKAEGAVYHCDECQRKLFVERSFPEEKMLPKGWLEVRFSENHVAHFCGKDCFRDYSDKTTVTKESNE